MFELPYFVNDNLVHYNVQYLDTMFTDIIMFDENISDFLTECKGRNIDRREAKEIFAHYQEFKSWRISKIAKANIVNSIYDDCIDDAELINDYSDLPF
jgi:hypothetical protein